MNKQLNRIIKKTTKIICIGVNYYSYIEKNNLSVPTKPIMFFKPKSSIVFNNEEIIYPIQSDQVEFEAELGVIISEKCKNVDRDDAFRVIFGYTCVNDMTARDLQRNNSQWAESKAFDTFCAIGPIIKPVIDFSDCEISCSVNGTIKQKDNIKNMIFSVPYLINYLSSIMTLMPGDIISTGTPAGSSKVSPKDIVEVNISQIGILRNQIITL